VGDRLFGLYGARGQNGNLPVSSANGDYSTTGLDMFTVNTTKGLNPDTQRPLKAGETDAQFIATERDQNPTLDDLTGGAGNDALVGGAGNDILTGGTGNDVFSFSGDAVFTVVSQGLDTIQDFTPGNDQISLSKSVFASVTSVVGQGFSVASEFAVVEDDDLAGTSNGLIVYSSSSGSLFYNQNGTAAGFGNGGEFAILATAPTLTASNFSLV